MKGDDKLVQLQKELDNLHQQLREQEEKMSLLQAQLNDLGSNGMIKPQLVKSKKPWSIENFIGLRIIHFIGIIVLVIGLSIGVKYAIDKNLISEGMRIVLAYGAGIVLYVLSVRLRKKYELFSAILFSGAMASLYFTTFGAYEYYNMISFGVAFTIMILLTCYTVFEALSYNRQEIALIGLVGAYGIPFLISKNEGRADLLFLYITLINSGVVFLSIKKQWKNVGRVAQAITWIIFLAWASYRYEIKYQWIGLLFMSLFFLGFLLLVFLKRGIQKLSLTVNDTYQIILNNMALYIAALFIFGAGFANADIAIITLIVSILIATEALVVQRSWPVEIFTIRNLASLSLMFFVTFIGFNWDGFTVSLLWLLTAVLVFAWGFKMRSVAARMAAIVLMGATLGKLVIFDSKNFSTIEKVITYLVLGVLLLLVSFFYQKFRTKIFGDSD